MMCDFHADMPAVTSAIINGHSHQLCFRCQGFALLLKKLRTPAIR